MFFHIATDRYIFFSRTSGNEEETNNDVPAGHLGRIRRNKD